MLQARNCECQNELDAVFSLVRHLEDELSQVRRAMARAIQISTHQSQGKRVKI